MSNQPDVNNDTGYENEPVPIRRQAITWWPSLLTHICVTKPRHVHLLVPRKGSCHSKNKFSNTLLWLHQPRLWFITAGYLVKRWFLPAATRARGQSNDLNREILASNLFNCRKEVINAPPSPINIKMHSYSLSTQKRMRISVVEFYL